MQTQQDIIWYIFVSYGTIDFIKYSEEPKSKLVKIIIYIYFCQHNLA